MDPVKNPFVPGAGTMPPELAGRDDIINTAKISLKRIKAARHANSLMMVGLRGVGKTVLLDRINKLAKEYKYQTLFMEAVEGKPFLDSFVAEIRTIIFSLDKSESAKDKIHQMMRVLKGFSVAHGLIKIELSIDPKKGVADSGDLETDLPHLLTALGETAKAASVPIAIFIDEMQYLSSKELSALIMAMHKINQSQLPFILMGAGLPQIRGFAGNSKSYAERLFQFHNVGKLNDDDARDALMIPIKNEAASIENAAVDKILLSTQKYPYFLQQWGYEAWNISQGPTITYNDVLKADDAAISRLDESFFSVRFERCTPSEKRYMRALAQLGPGIRKSGEVAELLNVKVQSLGPVRSSLIKKGMVYMPSHGDVAFTVPLFDDYMKRVMPDFS